MLANGKIASLVCSAALNFSSVLKGLQLRFFVSAVSPSLPLCYCSVVPGVGLHLSIAWTLSAPVVLRLLSCRVKARPLAPNGVRLFFAFPCVFLLCSGFVSFLGSGLCVLCKVSPVSACRDVIGRFKWADTYSAQPLDICTVYH